MGGGTKTKGRGKCPGKAAKLRTQLPAMNQAAVSSQQVALSSCTRQSYCTRHPFDVYSRVHGGDQSIVIATVGHMWHKQDACTVYVHPQSQTHGHWMLDAGEQLLKYCCMLQR